MHACHYLLYLLVLQFLQNNYAQEECDRPEIDILCNQKELQCHSCLKLHYCCHWCFAEDFGDETRCGTEKSLLSKKCTEFQKNSNSVKWNKTEEEFAENIQIKPQQYSIKLRKGVPVNLTFQYKVAKDFPLDLYYLMDVSFSMKEQLDNMKNLGKELSTTLKSMSKQTKLALGFFMDKTELPFYRTAEEYFSNPCKGSGENQYCNPGYLFKNSVNFTDDEGKFLEKLQNVSYTANMDNLDGASIALMQILYCGEQFHWSPNSRKQILLVTDSEMHFAGDGLLSGSIKKHPSRCLSYEELNSNVYDYPSLEEIHNQLKINKTQLIIATQPSSYNYYHEFHNVMNNYTFVETLRQNDTEGILKLTESGFKNFLKRVEFDVEPKKHLRIDFFTNCDGDKREKKKWCDNVKRESIVEFYIELELIEDVPNNLAEEIIEVTEKSISEVLKIHIEYTESCTCTSYKKKECQHGILECGNCKCEEFWIGELCDTECKNDYSDYSKCRNNNSLSSTCSNNGDCKCGKCYCDSEYTGDFCQYQCPTNRYHQICDGHGQCVDGKCICQEDYEGELCSCSKHIDNCQLTEDVCLGNGTCVCNKCECNEDFTGSFCENENGENLICSKLEKIVLGVIEENKTVPDYYVIVNDTEARDDYKCEVKYEENQQFCIAKFDYVKIFSKLVLHIRKYQCGSGILQAGWSIGTFTFLIIICAGVAAVMIFKCINYIKDRREYAQYEKNLLLNQKNVTNPLYNDPQRTYINPMRDLNKFD